MSTQNDFVSTPENRDTVTSDTVIRETESERPLSSLSDEELDSKNPEHHGEILQRLLNYYNGRVTAIKQSALRLDTASLSYDLREMLFDRIRGRPLSNLKKAIDGCLSQKWNREKGSRMRLYMIFRDVDTLNGYIADSETPEVDDSGNEIAEQVEHQGIY